jgi:hypothetical protein
LATWALGVAIGCGQDERSRVGTLHRDRGTLERGAGARLVPALKAGYRWLDVYCGGCRLVKPIDLAAIDIHPQASLTSLILSLQCRQCGRHGPMPQLIGLSRFPPVVALEGIVSKRLGSLYGSGRSRDWLKFKKPSHPAVQREFEEDWGRLRR